MDHGKKGLPKVLTTDDIRQRARDWTLAGDVGLLAHLEQFSKNILNKTQETQNNFNELVDHYEELYIKVGNITNQFLALQNCQFVENRVYDEETPTEDRIEVKVQNEAEQEKLLLMQYKEAVEIGVKLLDTHFQEVQLPPSSDSDEDDENSNGKSVIWKPNNPYIFKKFPLLIGSAEWWADDNVGLRANEDALETDRIISEPESDMESLKSVEKTTKSSSSTSLENIKSKPAFLESSSEDLFGFDKSENLKSNSTDILPEGSNLLTEESSRLFEKKSEAKSKKRRDSFHENESHEQTDEKSSQNETKYSKPINDKVDNAFTRELMAKLVSVTNKSEKTSKEKVEEKSRENSPPTADRTDENLFDETDDSCDLFSAKTSNTHEKSPVNKGLFFGAENDDELFKSESDLFSGSNLFENENLKKPEKRFFEKNHADVPKETKKSDQEEVVKPKKNVVNDLFDDLDDEDTLFTAKPISPKPFVKSMSVEDGIFNKATASSGLSWDNDEGLFNSIDTEIDDDIFHSSDLFDVDVKKASEFKGAIVSKNKDIQPEELFAKHSEIIQKTEETIQAEREENPVIDCNTTKIASGFDSFADPYGFFISKETNNLKIGMLDSEDEDDLFSTSVREEKKADSKGMVLPEDDDRITLFTEKSKPADSVSVSSSRSSLFDDLNPSKSRLASVFEKDKGIKQEDDFFSAVDDSFLAGDSKSGKDLFSTKSRDKEKLSLFDDCQDVDDDDLFGVAKHDDGNDKSLSEKPWGDCNKYAEEDIFKKNRQSVRGVKSFIGNLGDDDLFKTSEISTKLRESKSDVLIQSEEKLFVDNLDDSDLFSGKPTAAKPKPPSSLSFKGRETAPKRKAVHKLNIPDNLKVKFESAAKNMSSGIKPSEEEKKSEPKEEEVLDVSLQPSVLLKCPSKDRVKIPGRRRPQSRRARQEAIRHSGTWDQPTSPDGNPNITVPPKKSQSSPVASNPLSPSTDEEDFFKVPELDTNFEKEDQSIFKSDLFESSKSSKVDDNLLFDGAPIISPLSPKKSGEPEEKHEDDGKAPETESLFGFNLTKGRKIFDDDDDDELEENNDEILFKPSKSASGDSTLFSSPRKKEEKFKRPLFEPDFDDEEDDLFKGKSSVTPSMIPIVDRLIKKGDEAKAKGNSTFADPLGLLTKNE